MHMPAIGPTVFISVFSVSFSRPCSPAPEMTLCGRAICPKMPVIALAVAASTFGAISITPNRPASSTPALVRSVLRAT